MYFFTVLDDLTQSIDGFINLGTSGARGFSDNLEEIKEWLYNNVDDLYDEEDEEYGHFTYALIEKIEKGINEPVEWKQLFKFDKNKNGYVEIDMPDFVKNYEMSLIF